MRMRLISASHFSAAHRLHRDDWDEATNRRIFDKCNNENGHGHTYGLEVTVAFVVPASGRTVDPAALDTHCRARMASYKRPREIHVVSELPKTATGKVQRFALRARMETGHQAAH